jgi:hypothetical protein
LQFSSAKLQKKHRKGFLDVKRYNVNVYVADIFFSLCLGKYYSLPREKLWCAKKSSALYVILCRG